MKPITTRIREFLVNSFTLTPYLVSQEEAEASIREGSFFRGTNLIILIIAIFIASLGLNTNSTAVIIGAMLISPLMGPIIGIGLAIGIQDFELLKKSLRNLCLAAAFSIAASAVYFLISPVSEGHSELLARTSPTIYDVLIGFFGGAAGIFAISSKSKGNVIPGVAIATALMPPLCTVGFGLATWQMQYFFGALYLFLINSIFICFATFIGVKLMKYHPVAEANTAKARRVRRWVYIIALVCILPSIYLTYNMLKQSRFEINAHRFVSEECIFPNTRVLASTPHWSRHGSSIDITLIGARLPQDSLAMALSAQLKHYGLKDTHINIIQGTSELASAPINDASVRDIYELSQAALNAKQATIDSLRSIIAADEYAFSAARDITPELKVVFPDINSIALTRAVFASTDTLAPDTLNIALASFSRPVSDSDRRKLIQYLQARLNLPSITLIPINLECKVIYP